MKVKLLSFFETPWTVTYQAPLSMGFSRQEYWSGLPFPSPWDLPDPGMEPGSPALQVILYQLSHQGRFLKLSRKGFGRYLMLGKIEGGRRRG